MLGSKFVACAAALMFCLSAAAGTATMSDGEHWVATWSAAADDTGPALSGVTLRQVVRSSLGGTMLRIRLSNLYGAGPVRIGAAHLALHGDGAAIQAGSDHAMTFAGMAGVTLNKGESIVSDPVTMDVAPLQELAISLYVKSSGGASSRHGVGMTSGYLSRGADATADFRLTKPKTVTSWFYVTDVEVVGEPAAASIVALGDSITDGVGSTPDTERRWTGVLAARLQGDPKLARFGVVNAGIAGNRVLHDADDPFRGDNALLRIDRDALDKSGVRWMIVQMGNNDIGADSLLAKPSAHASAQQIIAGLQNLVAQAHVNNIKVMLATLPPFIGADFTIGKRSYASAEGERKREQVNAWIRSGQAADAVVDFDLALRDPSNPQRINPLFDAGDHLHPNDAGHQALADAFDLHQFAQSGQAM